jgi:isopentenyl diphosphate isomerase/L-lactate dehydrogenase-like FMN-dependent dehydrogenase
VIEFRPRENRDPLSIHEYRARAKKALPSMVWAYIDGGAEDLTSLAANRAAFSRWSLRSKVLTGHQATDLTVKLGGCDLSFPVLLAPTGLIGLSHWTGEVASAQAAERAGTRAIISTAASYSPEEVAEATKENHFFQLYPWSTLDTGARGLTEQYLKRA